MRILFKRLANAGSIVSAGAIAIACSSSSTPLGSKADDCQSRCEAVFEPCLGGVNDSPGSGGTEGEGSVREGSIPIFPQGANASYCTNVCGKATEGQLQCAESAGCVNTSNTYACFTSSTGSSTSTKGDAGTTSRASSCECPGHENKSSYEMCTSFNNGIPSCIGYGEHWSCFLAPWNDTGTCVVNCTSLAGPNSSWCPSGTKCTNTVHKNGDGTTLYSCQ